MSDRDTLLAMFQKAANRPNVSPGAESYYDLNPKKITVIDGSIVVENGYSGFVAQFDFDDSGELTNVSAWE